jgi:MFS family permease
MAWFNFCLDFRLYAPVAILYFADVSGSFARGMSVFSVAMLAGAIFEVPTGVFSDRIGRKRTLVLGSTCSVISVALYAAAGHAAGAAYAVLLAGAAAEGLARALYSGNNAALLHDTLAELGEEDDYQDHLGKTAAMFQAALAVSALAGSVLAFISFGLVMWLSTLPQVAGLLITLRMVEPDVIRSASGNVFAHTWTALRHILRQRRLRLISAASILGYALGESAFLFRAAFIELLWPVWAIGAAQMLANVGAGISFWISGRLIRRFGEFRLLVVGRTYSIAIQTVALAVPTVLSPALMSTTSLFFGVNAVAVGGLMQRDFTTEQRATMGSLTALGSSLAFAAYALILGGLADWLGTADALLITQGLAITGIVLYWITFRGRAADRAAVVPAITKN